MPRSRVAALACVLVIGVGSVGAGLTAASAVTVAHVQDKPTKAEQSLLKHAPSSYADTCTGDTAKRKELYAELFSAAKKQIKSIVAAIYCAPSGAPASTVTLTQWTNVADMNAFYQAVVADFNVEPNSIQNGPLGVCPTEGRYEVGAITGRVLCRAESGYSPELFWTNETLKIMGDAYDSSGSASDGALLYAWWNADSGGLRGGSSSSTPSSTPGKGVPEVQRAPALGVGSFSARVTDESAAITACTAHQRELGLQLKKFGEAAGVSTLVFEYGQGPPSVPTNNTYALAAGDHVTLTAGVTLCGVAVP
jgi:hypothetical protein